MSKFDKIVRMTQPELKEHVERELASAGYEPIVGDGYVYAKGDGKTPVLLTAHLDTVHKEPVMTIRKCKGVVSSAQGIGGDDRCGVHIILTILKATQYRPSILFCEDEEIGGVGSTKFTNVKECNELADLKFFIELDRAGSNDAVFYECYNPEFTDFILDKTGYKEQYGSFSDISVLSPATGVASVNLSCGYYNAHTTKEYVVLSEMEATKNVTVNLLKEAQKDETPQFEYIEYVYSKNWKYGYGDYYDYTYANTWSSGTTYGGGSKELYLMWYDIDGNLRDETVIAGSINEAWGQFFLDNPNVCFNDILDFDYM